MSADERFMRRALALARRGGRRVSPNPWVGCVLVRGGRVVAEGWHAAFGGPHAEAAALARAGGRARGATAYVNLEPCCHLDKKTPPCAPALIRAGVSRVVAGSRDPNPRVSGRGLKMLRAAGVRVTAGVLEAECEALNRPFSVRMREGRPFVVLKAAASLDGRIATARGESKWITSEAARRAARRLRASCDAVLVGIGTVLADDPALTARGAGPEPLRAVLDTRLRVPATARVLGGGAPALLLTARRAVPARLRGRVRAARVARGRGGLDLRAALKALLGLGVASVLVEGGARVHAAFLEAGLVDRVALFLAPKLIGGERAPSFFGGRGSPSLRAAPALRDMRVRRVGPDLLVTGDLAR